VDEGDLLAEESELSADCCPFSTLTIMTMAFHYVASIALFLVGSWTFALADLNGSIPFVDWIDPSLVLSRLAGDPLYARQSERLISLAREALTHPLHSVMSSPYVPPNGDAHYYYSWAPYWWPDASCNLTDANYMHDCNYTNRDGFINPDVELATQVRSLANISSDALTLALVGTATSDRIMLARASLILRLFYLDHLTRMLPDLTYAQVYRGANEPWPWHGRQYGIIDGRGQIYVQLAAALLLNRSRESGWTRTDTVSLDRWFSQFQRWLNSSALGQAERDGANNHATWWQVQALTYALRVGDVETAKATLSRYINGQFQQQINSSGEQPLEAVRERPFHYRCYNLQALLYVANLAVELKVDLFHMHNSQNGSIEAAINFIIDQVTPQPGTEDPTEFLPILYTAIQQYGDSSGKYAKGIVRFGGDLKNPPFWTLWHTAATQGKGAIAVADRVAL
jgi:Alginate lyase